MQVKADSHLAVPLLLIVDPSGRVLSEHTGWPMADSGESELLSLIIPKLGESLH